jgi:hypothetical protein
MFLLLFGPVFAGLRVVQQIESAGSTSEVTILVDGVKMRSDLTPEISVIMDGESGETIYLRHPQQTFSRVSPEEAKRLADRVQDARGEAPQGTLVPAGEKKMIGNYQAELYTWSIGAMKMRLWISPDFPNAQAVQAQLDRLQQRGIAAASAQMMPPAGSLPAGLRLRTEIELNGQKVSYTILSAKEETLDPASFAIPTAYRETPFALPARTSE